MNKMKRMLKVLVMFLLAFNFTTHIKAQNRNYVEVEVPAIYIPVDPVTFEQLEGMDVRPTFPTMYEKSEVAEIIDEIPFISYRGYPKPDNPGSWSSANFHYYGNVMFRNKFHRVVANGMSQQHSDFPFLNSSIVKLEYGNFVDENYTEGLHGMGVTPYQEGETLKLYLASVESSLSNPTFRSESIDIYKHHLDEEIRNQIYNNIEKVVYLEIFSIFNYVTLEEESISETLKTMWLFDIDADDFLKDENGDNIDFNHKSFGDLELKEYVVVFPFYFEKTISNVLSAPDKYSRDRYTVSDSIYFNVNFKELITKVVVKHVDEEGNDLVEPTILSGVYGDAWIANELDVPGYRLIEAPEKTAGIFGEEDFEIVFVYEVLDSKNVVVSHVDKEGNNLVDPVILSGEYGEEWETFALEIENYRLIKSPETTSGTFDEEEKEVVYEYELVPMIEEEREDKTPPTGLNNNTYIFVSLIAFSSLFILLNKKKKYL